MQPLTKDLGMAWNPGSWKYAPWLAFASIFGFLSCCTVLTAILVESNGRKAATWPNPSLTVPVSVLLSLTVDIANFFLAVALDKGYEVLWWTSALKNAELRRLQFDLDVQRRIFAVLGRNCAIDKIAIAAVVSFMINILDGPLIQRAFTISTRAHGPKVAHSVVHISNASLPADFSTFGAGYITQANIFSPLFRQVSRAYSNRENISLPIQGCETNTTCLFTLFAPRFDVNCTNDKHIAYDFHNFMSASSNDQIAPFNPTFNQSDQITTFDVELYFGNETQNNIYDYGTINTTVLYKNDAACAGNVIQRECVLRLATVGYPITVTDGVATLKSWQLDQNETIAFTELSMSGQEELFTGSSDVSGLQTMLGGVYAVAKYLYASHFAFVLATGMIVPLLYNASEEFVSDLNYFSSDKSTYSNCNMT